MSDLLPQETFPKLGKEFEQTMKTFRRLYPKKRNLINQFKYMISIKKGGLRYLSPEVYGLLKIWLKVQWKKDKEMYLAMEQYLNKLTGVSVFYTRPNR